MEWINHGRWIECGIVDRMDCGKNNYVRNTLLIGAVYTDRRGLWAYVSTGCTNEYNSFYSNDDWQDVRITTEEFCALLPFVGERLWAAE